MKEYTITEYRQAVNLVSDFLMLSPDKWPTLSIAKRPPKWAMDIIADTEEPIYGVSYLVEPGMAGRSRIWLDLRNCKRDNRDSLLVLMHELAHVKFRLDDMSKLEEGFASGWERPLYNFYTKILKEN